MNKIGRPMAGEKRYDEKELDRLLVHGYYTGDSKIPVYLSYRELGRKYGVSNSTISNFSKMNNCMLRREQEKRGRVTEELDEMINNIGKNEVEGVRINRGMQLRQEAFDSVRVPLIQWLFLYGEGKIQAGSDDFIKMANYLFEIYAAIMGDFLEEE